MSVLSNNTIAQGIYSALKDKGSHEAHKIHENVVQFLTRKRLMGRAPAIIAQLQKIINFEKGIVSAVVKSVHRLTEKEESELKHFIKKRYAAKEVDLKHIFDKSLLGGVRIEVNDEVVDLSVRNQINQLQEYLTTNHE